MPNYRAEMLKLEKISRKDEIDRLRSECITKTRTSQFYMQNIWVPYFWDKYLKQGADDSEDKITFLVTETDRMFFTELNKKKSIKLFTAYGRVIECTT